MTQTHCPSTQALTDTEATATLAAALNITVDDAIEIYRRWWGRKMCAEPTCHGAVLQTKNGIRRHVPGSNLTEVERVALTAVNHA